VVWFVRSKWEDGSTVIHYFLQYILIQLYFFKKFLPISCTVSGKVWNFLKVLENLE
jgi:hypothetical protein